MYDISYDLRHQQIQKENENAIFEEINTRLSLLSALRRDSSLLRSRS